MLCILDTDGDYYLVLLHFHYFQRMYYHTITQKFYLHDIIFAHIIAYIYYYYYCYHYCYSKINLTFYVIRR